MPILKMTLEGDIPSYKPYRIKQTPTKIIKYNPIKKLQQYYKGLVKDQLPQSFELITTPIKLSMVFYRRIPEYRKKLLQIGDPHVSKPDLSNLIKFVEDVMKDIVFEDDNLIHTYPTAKKIYDDTSRVDIEVEW